MSESLDYRLFDGEPIKLWFGDDHKPLYVQEGILKDIPFFEKSLSFASAARDHTSDTLRMKVIDLHDCNAKAVADVIHYTLLDEAPSIQDEELENIENGHKQDDGVKLYVNAWIIADRFGLEDVANMLIDRVIERAESKLLNPSLILCFTQADHEDSHFCDFMIRDIAYQLVKKKRYRANLKYQWTSYAHKEQRSLNEERKDFQAICEELPPSILARILHATQTVRTCPTEEALRKPCALHKHEVTDICIATKP